MRLIRISLAIARLKHAVRGGEAGERRLALGLVAEHAHVDLAVRRSGLVSTEVTVTNPIRGSSSSVEIADPITSRMTSLTLRMRSVIAGDYQRAN